MIIDSKIKLKSDSELDFTKTRLKFKDGCDLYNDVACLAMLFVFHVIVSDAFVPSSFF
jgi:hypothetical protein